MLDGSSWFSTLIHLSSPKFRLAPKWAKLSTFLFFSHFTRIILKFWNSSNSSFVMVLYDFNLSSFTSNPPHIWLYTNCESEKIYTSGKFRHLAILISTKRASYSASLLLVLKLKCIVCSIFVPPRLSNTIVAPHPFLLADPSK